MPTPLQTPLHYKNEEPFLTSNSRYLGFIKKCFTLNRETKMHHKKTNVAKIALAVSQMTVVSVLYCSLTVAKSVVPVDMALYFLQIYVYIYIYIDVLINMKMS